MCQWDYEGPKSVGEASTHINADWRMLACSHLENICLLIIDIAAKHDTTLVKVDVSNTMTNSIQGFKTDHA